MSSGEVTWRPLQGEDAEACTSLAFKSKRGWDYPEEWIQLWRDGLTVTPELIAASWSLAAIDSQTSKLVGFVLLMPEGDGAEVEHLWIEPERQGEGLGRRLMAAAMTHARGERYSKIAVISDPHAEGFYARLGGRSAGSVPSLREGRELPRLIFEL